MKQEFLFEACREEDLDFVSKEIIKLSTSPIYVLKGELGAGKTALTKYLAKNLGSKDAVSSPTYSLVNQYSNGNKSIYHFDLYRLENPHEVSDIGIDEYLNSGDICIIEWPEIYLSEIDQNYTEISIFIKQNCREIKVTI